MKLKAQGFSLVEILVVLVLIGLMAGLVAPQLIKQLGGGQSKAAKAQISRLSMAVETFYLDTGSLPNNLSELVNAPGGVNGWNGPYVKSSTLKDPWQQDFQYNVPGQHGEFDIISYGADKSPGGEGKNQDITSWD